MAAELTPMMRQYLAMKREIPEGAILMFRLGDFYEMFAEDAQRASPVLGATLTQRNGMPMCGVPYHALDSYLAKLIRAGMTAALCDQVEDPKFAKGLVRREITRIVTPGTVTEDGILDETATNYVAAASGLALALMDLPTGEFLVEEFPNEEKLAEALERYSPSSSSPPTWTPPRSPARRGWTPGRSPSTRRRNASPASSRSSPSTASASRGGPRRSPPQARSSTTSAPRSATRSGTSGASVSSSRATE